MFLVKIGLQLEVHRRLRRLHHLVFESDGIARQQLFRIGRFFHAALAVVSDAADMAARGRGHLQRRADAGLERVAEVLRLGADGLRPNPRVSALAMFWASNSWR